MVLFVNFGVEYFFSSKFSYEFTLVCLFALVLHFRPCVDASMQDMPPNYVDPDGESPKMHTFYEIWDILQ